MRPTFPTVLMLVCAFAAGCSPGSGRNLVPVDGLPDTAPAGELLEIAVQVQDDAGVPVPDVAIGATVVRGGGVVESEVVSDAEGRAVIRWTLGIVPVDQALDLTLDGAEVEPGWTVRGVLTEPLQPSPFGDVEGYLTAVGNDGTTEDLAFDDQGRLLLGVPGGVLAMGADQQIEALPLTGDPLDGPLGIAVDAEGGVWIADSAGSALRHVSPAGEVTTPLTTDGSQDLLQPNYVAVAPSGLVLVGDPCLGELIAYDPVADEVTDVLVFDRATEGGPNGFAFDASGERLYVVTESVVLSCLQYELGPADVPVATLFQVALEGSGFGARTTMAAGIGLFGDGVALDAEGNLYVVVDTEEDLALDESAVWVLPGADPDEELARFLSVDDRLLANLAFGQGEFGETALYIALLEIAPFSTGVSRGVEVIELGIPGQPLLP